MSRWPQSRGVPALVVVVRSLNDMGGYTEAEITAARASANVVFTMETDPEMGGDDLDPVGEEQTDGSDEFGVEPGMGMKLPIGRKMTMLNPSRPNTALDPFMRYMLREVSAGLDIPYDALSQDYSQTNYSSSRLAIIESREAWKILQRWWIRSFREPLHALWLRQAVLSRSLPAISVESYMMDSERFEAVTWQARKWGWIDPQKDVAASKEAEKAGYTTKTQILAENGIDLEDYIVERKQELEALEEAEIVTDTDPGIDPQMQLDLKPDKPPAPDQQDEETDPQRGSFHFGGSAWKN
jgi:lambda family phage portal protein